MNQDEFAEALDSAYSKLKKFMKETTADLDAEINVRSYDSFTMSLFLD